LAHPPQAECQQCYNDDCGDGVTDKLLLLHDSPRETPETVITN